MKFNTNIHNHKWFLWRWRCEIPYNNLYKYFIFHFTIIPLQNIKKKIIYIFQNKPTKHFISTSILLAFSFFIPFLTLQVLLLLLVPHVPPQSQRGGSEEESGAAVWGTGPHPVLLRRRVSFRFFSMLRRTCSVGTQRRKRERERERERTVHFKWIQLSDRLHFLYSDRFFEVCSRM